MKKGNKPVATKETLRVFNEIKAKAEAAENESAQNELYNEAYAYKEKYNWYDQVFVKDGKKGVVNICEDIIVPAMFDEIAYLYCYFRLYSSYIVKNGGKYGLVASDGTGKMILPCEYEAIHPILTDNVLCVKKDDKFGVMSWNGTPLTPIDNDGISLVIDEYAILYKDGKEGLFDISEWTYVRPEYDDIEFYGCDEPVRFIRDGKTYYIDTEGNVYESGKEEDSEYLLIGYQIYP